MGRQIVSLEGGQQLGYQVYGNGNKTVLLLHGLVGGSWLSPLWRQAIERAGVRCVALERPGYGKSSAIALGSVADWMPLIRQAADELGLRGAQVVGASAGAPYAYATACALPDEIEKVFILGGVPAVYEPVVMRHYTPESRQAYQSYIDLPLSAIEEYYTASLAQSLKAEVALTKGEYILKTIEEVVAQKCFGMAQESKLQPQPWNLPLGEIRQPVFIRHAAADEMVPYAAAKEMPGFFSNCDFSDIPTEGFEPGESVHMRAIAEEFCRVVGE